ncbi:MAG: hypothetical protein E7652_07555 [Ruminococcaceae bacterium]|nr:hypothetical protein [Oscillospiraceae bacterium]
MGIERLNEFWPDWKIGEVLGEGSFGRVYRAEKREMGFSDYSAIKHISIPTTRAEYDALRNEGMSVSDTKEYFRDIVKDFVNEIRLMTSLKGAPNIVAVEDYKLIEKSDDIGYDIFIRMELLRSFKELLDDHIPAEAEVIKMALDITNALEICQKENIIHRDIKPANIFMDKYGNFKLGDFGIAKELEKTTGAASAKGTFSFMAPEVAHGQRYDNTVDIYSLGLVMYTLLNGNRAPFIPRDGRVTYSDRKNANDRRLAGEPLPKIEGVSHTLNDIILTACSYDPARRFKSASAFKNALKSYNNAPKPTPAPSPVTSVPKQNIDSTTAARKPESMPQTEVARKPEPKPEIDATVAVAHKPEVKREENIEPVKAPKKKKGGIIAVAIILVVALLAVAIVPGMLDNAKNKGTTGDVEWSYRDNTLVISGEGKMGDYDIDGTKAPWTKYNEEIEEIVVEEGVTSIGDYAFYYYSLGDYAFYSCDSLTSVTIPDSVTSIGDHAFYSCTSLTSVTIPDSVTSIGDQAFSNCENLTSVAIPDSVTSIGNDAFSYCDSLTSVTIPDSVTSIGDEVFSSCDSLTSVTIPDSVTSIGDFAFSWCTSLTSVTIPDSVTSIGYGAFFLCDSLTIECPSGSYAEQYAIEEGIPYTAM